MNRLAGDLILSGYLAPGNKLNLANKSIDAENANSLSEVLSSGLAPQGLTIDLESAYIGALVGSLSKALSSGRAPKGMKLCLGLNSIYSEGAALISEALSSGKAPQGLTLDLRANNIGDEGAASIFQALSSGKAPQGLTLDLRVNKIGDEGAFLLFKALSSGNAPQGLRLYLDCDKISPKLVSCLVRAIKQELFPIDLEIFGIAEIEEALSPESISVNRLVKTCINLTKPRKLVKNDNSVWMIDGLPMCIVSYIASFIHPKGAIIGNNVSSFFHVRDISVAPLARLQIDITKVGEALGIGNVEVSIQNLLKSYLFNSSLTPKAKKSATNNLISALRDIEKEESQILVRNELAALSENVPSLTASCNK